MPRLDLLASPHGAAIAIEAPRGGRLLDACDEASAACDEASAPIAFSCRSADCGTCRVEVLAGASWLEPATDAELDVLRLHGARASERLACQVVILPGDGRVLLRWTGRTDAVSANAAARAGALDPPRIDPDRDEK